MKTLLLSALVPRGGIAQVVSAERLAALNHGTIRTPIPGKEGQEVLRRCRTWAASVGEIRIGEETNPTISVQLSGVDTESIIKQAEGEDRHGNRIERVGQMLFEQVGVSPRVNSRRPTTCSGRTPSLGASCSSKTSVSCRNPRSKMTAKRGS